jgi:hypothetical protein
LIYRNDINCNCRNCEIYIHTYIHTYIYWMYIDNFGTLICSGKSGREQIFISVHAMYAYDNRKLLMCLNIVLEVV